MDENNKLIFVASDKGMITFKKENNAWKKVNQSIKDTKLTCIDSSDDTIIAGSKNGLYLSKDTGESWHEVEKGLSIKHIRWVKFHHEKGDILLVGTEPAAIFISKDGGHSFQECEEVGKMRDKYGWYLPYSSGSGCVRGFSVKNSRAYAAVEVGGALRSDDYGDNWQLVEGSTGKTHTPGPPIINHDVHSIHVHPSSSELVFAPCGGGFFRSKDGGEKWEKLYECYCRAVWVDPEDPDRILLGPADYVDKNGRIEISIDSGQTWDSVSKNLSVPWSNHMVERFTQAGNELFAVLSSGEIIFADIGEWKWSYILNKDVNAHAIAVKIISN